MTKEDRIKLAEAMGWKELADREEGWPSWYHDDKPQEECRLTENLPDPVTDANDDYAVLEWMLDHDGWTYHTHNIDIALDHIGVGDRWAVNTGTWAEVALCLMNGDIETCPDCVDNYAPQSGTFTEERT